MESEEQQVVMPQYAQPQSPGEESVYGNQGYIPPSVQQHQERMNNVAIEEIDNKSMVLRISRQLRGFVKVDGEWKRLRKPLMDDEGVNDIMCEIEPHLDKNTIMAHLRGETFDQLAKAIRNNLIFWISSNEKKYHMEKSKRSIILDIAFNPILFTLTRAEQGDEKQYRSNVLKLTAGNQFVEKPPKRGLFGMWR